MYTNDKQKPSYLSMINIYLNNPDLSNRHDIK